MALRGRIRQGIALFNELGHLSSDSLSTQSSTHPRFLIAPENSLGIGSADHALELDVISCLVFNFSLHLVFTGRKKLCYLNKGKRNRRLRFWKLLKANVLEKVESEIVDLVEATKRSPKFLAFTKDLSVPKDSRVKAIQAICDDSKFSDITKNFLVVVAENGRLRNLDSIAKKFVELTMAYKGEMKATVTTVIPLPPQEEQALKETLHAIIGAGKKVHLKQKIDPSILGGIVVEFNQKVLDMSIKTRALQMERFLREPINFADI